MDQGSFRLMKDSGYTPEAANSSMCRRCKAEKQPDYAACLWHACGFLAHPSRHGAQRKGLALQGPCRRLRISPCPDEPGAAAVGAAEAAAVAQPPAAVPAAAVRPAEAAEAAEAAVRRTPAPVAARPARSG